MNTAPLPGVMHPATAFLEHRTPGLADWYGDPLAPADAAALLQAAEQDIKSRLCRNVTCFPAHLLWLICRDWRQTDSALHYRQLASTVSGTERALLELVWGQLLISRKLHPATVHLERGFRLAARELDTVDYFRLVRRHEVLGYLLLGDAPLAPQSLDSLLAEAAVIRCLRGNDTFRLDNAHRDTLG